MIRLHYLPWYLLLVALLLTGAWGVPLHVDKTLSPMQRWAELSPWLGPAPSVPACRWLNFQRFIFTLETSAEWIDSTAEAFACSHAEPTPEQSELLNRALPGQELLRVFCPERPLTMLRGNSESGYSVQDMLIAETTQGKTLLYMQLSDAPPHSSYVLLPRFRHLHPTLTRAENIALIISPLCWLCMLTILPPATLLLFRSFRFASLRQRLMWYGSGPCGIFVFGLWVTLSMWPSTGAWVCLIVTLLSVLPAILLMAALRPIARRICGA